MTALRRLGRVPAAEHEAADFVVARRRRHLGHDLAARVSGTDDVYAHRPDRIEQYRVHRNQMVAAILSGDEEMASLATRRCSTIVVEWMQDDMGSGSFQSDPLVLSAR